MPRSVTLAAVGDLQLGDSPTSVGYGFYSRYRGADLLPLFRDVMPALADADILFGNLETTLVPPPPGQLSRDVLQLRGEPAFASALARVGFTVLNVANNHAVQFGDATFHSTVRTVRAAGIQCVGVRGTAPWATEPVYLRHLDVAMLGYCLRPRQYGPAVPPYAEGDRESICRDVARLKAEVPTVIVSLHWGEEFVAQPSVEEVELAHAIIDAGASLIIGHHPHVTRPVERYKGAVIAYSLGNLMGDMDWYAPFRTGMVLRCTVGPEGTSDAVTRETRLSDDYTPVLAARQPMAPQPASETRALTPAEYGQAISLTLGNARRGAYRAALLNFHRTPFPIFAQLITQTVRNKLKAVVSRE